MALKSYRVTRKEIMDYYNPKVSAYQRMVNSINAGWYGQIIQRYSNTEILETYYNEYSYNLGQMVVYNPTTGQEYVDIEAGPAFWSVSSLDGLAFLNGTYDIDGLRKLKYCNNCTDGNGLPYNTVNNFRQRFTQLSSLVFGNELYDGFLFYDLDQPTYTNVYPSVKVDDGVNITYFFRTIYGVDQTLSKMSENTGQPEIAIEVSITTAPLIKPQEGQNSVITSCCEGTSYVISGQRTIGTILYNDSLPESYCWYVESLTNQPTTLPPTITFTSGGRSCGFCTKTNGCPPICEPISMAYSTDPVLVCSQSFSDYFIAWNVSKLYNFEDCGGISPSIGYYYDGKTILFWDGNSIQDYGECLTCESVRYSYSPLDGLAACYAFPTFYDWDSTNGILYNEGGCGSSIASTGYYSDGTSYFIWDGVRFRRLGLCNPNYVLEYCCTGEQRIFDSGNKALGVGTVIYFLADDTNYQVPCWRVVSESDAEPTITGFINGNYFSDCPSCISSTGILCP